MSMFIQTISIITFIAAAGKWQTDNPLFAHLQKHDSRTSNIVERLFVNNFCQQSLSAIFTLGLELNQSPNSH